MPDISSALKVLIRPIEHVARMYDDECGQQLAFLRAENNLKQLYTKLNMTQKVKTIWNVDRPIAISTFYYPAKIFNSPRKSVDAENLNVIEGNAVVLQGVIGQGKSILLRYLLGKEIRSGERVPIFIELRHVKAENLESFIHKQFDELLGIVERPKIFDLFAKEGKVSLLLDGFDEVESDQASSIIQGIEKLVHRYPKAKIVVTSRPNSGIESSPYFTVKKIAPLEDGDYWGFFKKVLKEDDILTSRIYSAVMAPKSPIRNLVRTPLLATLLTIVYRANQKIPSDFSEFYDELFQILLVRHDRAKPGFERKRRTKLSDRDLQHVFEAYCFKQKAQGLTPVSRTQALEIASASIKALNLQLDEGHFLDDIIKITCLLQEEGSQIEYLHQSIQEFFAARYIASRPEGVAETFYTKIQDGTKRGPWDQVLVFLDQIDQYRSSEYFFIPALESTLRHLGSIEETAPETYLREQITNNIGIIQVISSETGSESPGYRVFQQNFIEPYGIGELLSAIFQMLFRKPSSRRKKRWTSCYDQVTDGQFITYTDIALQCGEIEALDKLACERVDELRKLLMAHKTRIMTLDKSVEFMVL